MEMIDIKEKVIKTLGGFLDRNKEYVVEAYINNGMTDSNIGRIIILTDRICKIKDNKFMIKWDKDVNFNVRHNNFSLTYEEIMACYEETYKHKDLKISESVVVILKNGMKIDFECVGMRM